MIKDRYGNGLSTKSRRAMDAYDRALEMLRLYAGDPIAALDEALEADPEFTMAWAVRAGVLAQQMDKAYHEEAERSLRAGIASEGTAHERAHLKAAGYWVQGRYDDAVVSYARIAQENPRDLFAVQSAHVGCFFIGRQSDLRDYPLQALRRYRRGDDGYHALIGMAAFGLEECGDFDRALDLAHEAVELEPRDGWAVHAAAHVHEMRGDTNAGVQWIGKTAKGWGESGFAYHNWWHLALLHLDRGEPQIALNLYDTKIWPSSDAQVLMEWIDASAMLWRLHLEGVETGDRFEKLSQCWARARGDAIYAFNDLHALMAFIGAGSSEDAKRVLGAMRKAAGGESDNAYMARAIGLPLAEAFIAFGEGRYGACVENILAVRGIAQRFGGSHAQRDIITLTALHAAIKGGMNEIAEALAFERTTHKPQSPWAKSLAARASGIGGAAAAAV
ncbi:MAG: tetratricopeptide repeat protein [Caulobacterales bacterium]